MSDDEYPGPRGPGWGTQAGTAPGPEQGPVSTRPPLRRDRGSRMIAGVCGGLGRHLDIDPVVFRILFALLTFFGGFGLLAYAAAWLFVPDDGEHESDARKLLAGRGKLAAVAVAVLVALGFIVMVTVLSDGFDHAVPLLLLAAAIVAVLLWLGETGRRPPGPGDGPRPAAGGWGPTGPRAQPWWQRPVPTWPAPTPAEPGTASTAASTTSTAAPSDTAPEFGSNAASSNTAPSNTAPSNTTSVPKRRTRRVSGLTLSVALLILGVIGVLAEAGVFSIGWTVGLSLAVMAVGAGMVVGGLFGRARALIPLGLVLAVPLILASAINVPLRGETGDFSWAPVSAAAVDPQYNLAAGRGQLDLTAVDPNGGTVRVSAYVGAGHLTVTVPRDVAIIVTAHVGAGRMQFTDGSQHSGLDLTENFSARAESGSRGTIVLDLKAGLGDVEVFRAG